MFKERLTNVLSGKNSKKGFTLVELIIVLVILAVLAAILVPALLGFVDKAKGKQYSLEAKAIYEATAVYIDEQYAKGEDAYSKENLAGTTSTPIEVAATGLREIEKTAGYAASKITSVKIQGFNNGITAMEIVFEATDGKSITATLADSTWNCVENPTT